MPLEQRLVSLVRSSPALMAALVAARGLRLASWCIGAGAVRSLVWDHLHGFDHSLEQGDVDVAYFESPSLSGRDAELEHALRQTQPALSWEVTNQACVHDWFREHYAQHVEPLRSLEEGVATWPEYATCVGVTLNDDDSISVIAPHSLDDLFTLRVRHNPVRADAATFQKRIASKRFGARWPRLTFE